ncbi:hypothetical protein SNOG_15809 [Parastagonospora nodorum SN15]|uniref:Uncharacterized protein n=1 Tax=Phaeosphaeria nodorum (strain SN15 / ATCC MYA-4574 / FGSC 10173) TaxID=321614 RepID=Q0TXQ5_PHANO|nr:hypothetical protein SNOG_15809 [Parastagonospora nodorum SN15]EAT76904.1 hypothetical protein SNOG_15809 [Parastagonospora nodorum SN15]
MELIFSPGPHLCSRARDGCSSLLGIWTQNAE